MQQPPAARGGRQLLGTGSSTVAWPRPGRQLQQCDGGDQLRKLIYDVIEG